MIYSYIKQNWVIFLLLFIPGTFLCLWIPQLIFHPNDILLTGDGDGLKSYYCFFYHTHYDDSLIHFSGMNYPYGEHYLFTDGFPSIAWIIQMLPFLKPYGIAIIHFSLLLSLWLTPLFIYLLLKKFQAETWIAIVGSLTLFFLQPQFPRLFSHLSLAYSIFFPLSWYLFIRYTESQTSKKWMLILIINQLFWYFMHPYLGFMITLFYGIQWALQQFSKSLTWKTRLKDLIPIIIPVLSVQLLLKWTDHITDRPLNPYGFFEYQAHWKSIFLPPSGGIHHWIEQFISFEEFRWEGQAYVGFLTMLMLSIGIIYGIFQLFKRTKARKGPKQNLLFALIAAIFMLILSFGFPFNGNPGWLESLTFLKQFRALGRFAWPFYYVSGILGIVVLSFLYKQLSSFERNPAKPYISIVFVSVLLSLQILEAWNLLAIPKSFSVNLFDQRKLNKEENELVTVCKKGRRPAILPLPWFHIGSEIYGKEASTETLRNSFLLSAHTGIPLYAVMMGRTSKKQTVDYFHSLGMEKTWHHTHLNKLWIVHSPLSSLYSEDEELIFKNAHSEYQNHFGELRVFSKHTFNPYFKKKRKLIVLDDFNDQKKWGEQINHSKFRGLIENYNTLLTLDSSQVKPDHWYEITFDYYPDWTKPIDNVCYLEYIDPKSNEVRWFYARSIGSYTGIQKNFIRVKIRFKSQKFPCTYNCFLRGSGKNIFFEVDKLSVHEF